jgi:hypothetical protein
MMVCPVCVLAVVNLQPAFHHQPCAPLDVAGGMYNMLCRAVLAVQLRLRCA